MSLCVYMHGRMALRAVGLQMCVYVYVYVVGWHVCDETEMTKFFLLYPRLASQKHSGAREKLKNAGSETTLNKKVAHNCHMPHAISAANRLSN